MVFPGLTLPLTEFQVKTYKQIPTTEVLSSTHPFATGFYQSERPKIFQSCAVAATRFDRVTSGLWAPRATTAPCCCEYRTATGKYDPKTVGGSDSPIDVLGRYHDIVIRAPHVKGAFVAKLKFR